MAEQLSYECPHCRNVISVSPAVVNETIDCPECGQQFRANAPRGKPVNSGNYRAPDQDVVDREANAEETLRSVHPVVFRNHIILTALLILAVMGGIAGLLLALTGEVLLGLEGTVLMAISGGLLVAGILYAAYRWMAAIATTLTVTTERTILTRGILSKDTNEVQHDDIRNMKSDRNVFERLFNYGDIALSSSGQDDMEIVAHDIPDPQGILEIIRQHQ